MTNQRINDVDTITTISSTDRILVNTDTINNILEQIEKDDFIVDIVSADSGNLLDVGTDNKLAVIDSTITLQGNTFNGNSQLIQTTAAGKYPALDGSLITSVQADLPTSTTTNMPTLTNNGSDANNDIDFSAGFCWDLTTNIKITNTALTKRLDATFTAGTNQGGLDTGSKAVSTWYYCFAISKANSTADFLFSTSSTSPTMPTDYVNKRRIGCIRTDGSGNIIAFVFNKDTNKFIFNSIFTDLNTTTHTSVFTDVVLTCPPNKIPLLTIQLWNGAAGELAFLIKDKNNGQTDCVNGSVAGVYIPKSSEIIKVDNQSKIQYNTAGATTAQYYIHNRGFYDRRLD